MTESPSGLARTSGRKRLAASRATRETVPFLEIRASPGSSVFGETPGEDWQKWAWKASGAYSGGSGSPEASPSSHQAPAPAGSRGSKGPSAEPHWDLLRSASPLPSVLRRFGPARPNLRLADLLN